MISEARHSNFASRQPTPKRLGVTVLSDFILSEGVEQVVDNLLAMGVHDVATNPTVTAPAPHGSGTFQPPVDAGSSPRKFDRPLFGKHSLWLQSAPSFYPQHQLYENLAYGPRRVNALTDAHGSIVTDFVNRAVEAGLRVHFQLGAVQPTGLKDADRPRLPDGSLLKNRMADTASLASHAVRDYNAAYVRDLLDHYPQIAGFRIDWPEYPCYTLDEVFQDFGPQVRDWAVQHDFDFDTAKNGAQHFLEWLSLHLDNTHLDLFLESPFKIHALAQRFPGVPEWLRLKSALSTSLIADWNEIVHDIGGTDCQLTSHAFMPPFSDLTGFSFSGASKFSDVISPKLYTMHWPLMVWFWSRALRQFNSQLNEKKLVQAIALSLELATAEEVTEHAAKFRYPEPHEPHPISTSVQQRCLAEVRQSIPRNEAALVPLVHGYGPVEDFRSRFELAWQSDCDGVWINRYGYLSNAKLDGVQTVVTG